MIAGRQRPFRRAGLRAAERQQREQEREPHGPSNSRRSLPVARGARARPLCWRAHGRLDPPRCRARGSAPARRFRVAVAALGAGARRWRGLWHRRRRRPPSLRRRSRRRRCRPLHVRRRPASASASRAPAMRCSAGSAACSASAASTARCSTSSRRCCSPRTSASRPRRTCSSACARRRAGGDAEAVRACSATRSPRSSRRVEPSGDAGSRVAAKPHVVLVLGVNGSGKTTTIGKLAARYRAAGSTVVLGAGDTFRAAAREQLQRWGERTGCEVIAGAGRRRSRRGRLRHREGRGRARRRRRDHRHRRPSPDQGAADGGARARSRA